MWQSLAAEMSIRRCCRRSSRCELQATSPQQDDSYRRNVAGYVSAAARIEDYETEIGHCRRDAALLHGCMGGRAAGHANTGWLYLLVPRFHLDQTRRNRPRTRGGCA